MTDGIMSDDVMDYTQCTVKLRPNFQKIVQFKCTTNENRNLSEHDEKKSNWKFSRDLSNFALGWIFRSIYRLTTALKWYNSTNRDANQLLLIIFRHKKWRNRKILAPKGHIFYKAQLKCTTSKIIIFQKKRNLSVRLTKSVT